MKGQTDPYGEAMKKSNIYLDKLQIYIFCFLLLFTSSSHCRKDQFAVSYLSIIIYVDIEKNKYFSRQ